MSYVFPHEPTVQNAGTSDRGKGALRIMPEIVRFTSYTALKLGQSMVRFHKIIPSESTLSDQSCY